MHATEKGCYFVKNKSAETFLTINPQKFIPSKYTIYIRYSASNLERAEYHKCVTMSGYGVYNYCKKIHNVHVGLQKYYWS